MEKIDLNATARESIEMARQNFNNVPDDAPDRFVKWLGSDEGKPQSRMIELAHEFLEEIEE